MWDPDLYLRLLRQDQARRDAHLERLAWWAETDQRLARRLARRR